MKFLKNCFKKSNVENPSIDAFFDKVKIEEEKPELEGVSEPVLSFVKFLRENPDNFLWRQGRGYLFGLTPWILYDKKNKIKYKYCIDFGYLSIKDINHILTIEERVFLLKIHKEFYEKRKMDKRNNLRQKYIDIYCKDV